MTQPIVSRPKVADLLASVGHTGFRGSTTVTPQTTAGDEPWRPSGSTNGSVWPKLEVPKPPTPRRFDDVFKSAAMRAHERVRTPRKVVSTTMTRYYGGSPEDSNGFSVGGSYAVRCAASRPATAPAAVGTRKPVRQRKPKVERFRPPPKVSVPEDRTPRGRENAKAQSSDATTMHACVLRTDPCPYRPPPVPPILANEHPWQPVMRGLSPTRVSELQYQAQGQRPYVRKQWEGPRTCTMWESARKRAIMVNNTQTIKRRVREWESTMHKMGRSLGKSITRLKNTVENKEPPKPPLFYSGLSWNAKAVEEEEDDLKSFLAIPPEVTLIQECAEKFSCPVATIEEFYAIFDAHDEYGTGCIDPGNVSSVLKILAGLDDDPRPEDVLDAARQMDKDTSGAIDFTEFCSWAVPTFYHTEEPAPVEQKHTPRLTPRRSLNKFPLRKIASGRESSCEVFAK